MKDLLRFAAALVVLTLPAAAHAQPLKVTGGARAGVNFADFKFDVPEAAGPVPESLDITSFVAGGFVTMPLSRGFAFQPEVLYSMQGTKFSEDGVTVKLKVDYLQIPLLARLDFSPGSPVALMVGPSLGFRIRAKAEIPGAPEEFVNEFEDQIKGFDAGFVTGFGVSVKHVVVDGRYTWGLTNIAKDAEGGSVKNRVLSLTAGFRF